MNSEDFMGFCWWWFHGFLLVISPANMAAGKCRRHGGLVRNGKIMNGWGFANTVWTSQQKLGDIFNVPSGKQTKSYWKCLLKSWIYPLKMVIFHSYVKVYQRVSSHWNFNCGWFQVNSSSHHSEGGARQPLDFFQGDNLCNTSRNEGFVWLPGWIIRE